MEVVTGALSNLLPMLTNILQAEYKIQRDLKEQLRTLSEELTATLATLRRVQMVPWDDLGEECQRWASELREASYDMEDVLDTFLVSVDDGAMPPAESSKVKEFFKEAGKVLTLRKKLMARRDIANKIEVRMKNLKDITKRHLRQMDQDLLSRQAPVTKIDPRFSALYEKLSNLVGIEGPKSELTQMLFGDPVDIFNKEMKIVSVHGFGGLGKTTLAKVVQEEFKAYFKAVAFVSVGQNPDLKKVFTDILIDFGKEKDLNLAILDEKHLINKILDFLNDKRYFIVIDDLWDAKLWSKTISFAFEDKMLGSKIIITTRMADIAKAVEKGVGFSYEMKHLSDESSKVLFDRRIFGRECPENLSEISKKNLSKCGGIPLAIITISSLLASKSENVEEWSRVCESIGTGDGSSSDDMGDMRKILSFSYYDLRSDLKTCLLYLSAFPEDYKIRKDRLVWRWIAEGFIEHRRRETERQTLFEVGESCFNELMNRSLIQPAQMDKEGVPEACHVHDLVLDLIRSLVKKQNFVTVVLDDAKQNKLSQIKTVRWLALHCNTWPKKDMPKLRSLAIFNPAIIASMAPLSCCGLLRVLDLEGCYLGGSDRCLQSIKNLVHLRYIGLRNTLYSDELPLEKLQFLHTLNLIGTGIKKLPRSAVNLRQLMCLYVDQTTRLPNELRNLTSLEVLEAARVDSASIAEDLGHLLQLRVLVVDLGTQENSKPDMDMCKALVMSLGKLHKLQTLMIFSAVPVELKGSMERLGDLRYLRIEKTTLLPTWIRSASLPLLSHLEITVGKLRGADMEVLGKLPALRVLEVDVSGTGAKQVVDKFTVGKDAFPNLTRCRFCAYGVLPSMFAQGAMPKLESLVFVILLDDFPSTEHADLNMNRLGSLLSVRVALYGSRVKRDVGITVQKILKRVANIHCNCPTIDIGDYVLYSDLLEGGVVEVGPFGRKLFSLFQGNYQMIQDDPTVLERIFTSNRISDLINGLGVLPLDFASFLELKLGETNIDISGRSFGSVLQDIFRLIISKPEVSELLYKMMSGTISQTDIRQMMSREGFSEEDIMQMMSQTDLSRVTPETAIRQMMSQPELSGMSPVDINRMWSQMDFNPVDIASLLRLFADKINHNTGS